MNEKEKEALRLLGEALAVLRSCRGGEEYPGAKEALEDLSFRLVELHAEVLRLSVVQPDPAKQ